jgi:hypothetical protein
MTHIFQKTEDWETNFQTERKNISNFIHHLEDDKKNLLRNMSNQNTSLKQNKNICGLKKQRKNGQNSLTHR